MTVTGVDEIKGSRMTLFASFTPVPSLLRGDVGSFLLRGKDVHFTP